MTESAEGQREKTPRGPLGVVFLTVFLDLLGFGIIIPIRPFYAEAFGASPALVTLLGAAYSGMQFIFVPVWGRLSDRVGRRPVILWSISVSIVGYLIFGFAGTLPLLFLSRMLAGFGNANIATAQAVVADITTPANRARGMGLIGAAFGLGFVLGPAVGALLGQISPQAPAFAAAALGAINLLSALRFLPETLRESAPPATRRTLSADSFRRAARVPNVLALLVLALVATTAFSLMEQTLGLFIERIWVPEAVQPGITGHTEGHKRAALLTGMVLVVVGVFAVIVQGGLIGRLTRRFGERRLAITGVGVLAFGLASVPLLGETGVFGTMFIAAALLAIGSGLSNPSMNSLLSRSAPEDAQGEFLGLGQSMSSLGRVLSPAVAGLLFEVNRNVPFITGAVLMVLAFSMTLGLRDPEDPEPEADPLASAE